MGAAIRNREGAGEKFVFLFARISGAENKEVEGRKAQNLPNPIFRCRYRVYPYLFIVSKRTHQVRRGGIRRSLQNEGVLSKTLITSVFYFSISSSLSNTINFSTV